MQTINMEDTPGMTYSLSTCRTHLLWHTVSTWRTHLLWHTVNQHGGHTCCDTLYQQGRHNCCDIWSINMEDTPAVTHNLSTWEHTCCDIQSIYMEYTPAVTYSLSTWRTHLLWHTVYQHGGHTCCDIQSINMEDTSAVTYSLSTWRTYLLWHSLSTWRIHLCDIDYINIEDTPVVSDYIVFYVPLKNISLIWRRHHCRWRAAKLRPIVSAQGPWVRRGLYRATPTVTRDLDFSGLLRRTAPFSRLIRHTRGCGGSILARILKRTHCDIQSINMEDKPVVTYRLS
jgi:hypothetical protein